MKEKVVLAYSGGLDTTAIIPWLKENFDYEVICCCVDCGQGEELDGLEERAKLSGASKLYIEDIVDDFCDNYVVPCVQAHAVYENKYLLGTSMARPAIAKKLVEIARKEGASAICHGATGKGNDQIRFELGIKALAPDLKIIAPWRMTDVWTMNSREEEIAYCKQHGIDLPFDASHSYSRDRNLWHISHEGLELEDPANEPNYDHLLVLGVTPEKAPDEGEYVTMTFEKGVPKSINGEEMKVSDIIRKLNEEIVQDELNVKAMTFTQEVRDFTSYSFKPQLKTVGPKYGKMLGGIKAALSSIDGNAAMDELNSADALKLDINGQEVTLFREDLLIETAQMEGYVSENDNGITVVLDTNLSDELLEEGFVREIISKVQTMRKEAGFEVMDKIEISYEGTEKAEKIFAENAATIGDETLALKVTKETPQGYVKDWKINGENVTLGVEKK